MFDWVSISKRRGDKMYRRVLEKNPDIPPKMLKVMDFYWYKAVPFVLNVASFIILLWIFRRVADRISIEYMMALVITIQIMSMRFIGKDSNEKV